MFNRCEETLIFMFKRYVTLVGLSLIFSCLSGCEPFALSQDELQVTPPRFKASEIEAPEGDGKQLRVMSWNIKYGAMRAPFWFDCWGDQVSLSASQVESNMEELYALIREADPDILMVEEIELYSRRSAYHNMVQGILDHTQLNYGAYYETWNSRYIPSEGLGRMSLGNAIFSKYPITGASKIAQDPREDQDGLTAYFYIQRFIGRAEIELPESVKVAAYVVHTEAYDEDGTKGRQIEQIYDVVSAETLPFVLGGDFNELPPTAAKVEDFPDERQSALCGEDYDQPPYTPEVMSPFYVGLKPWIDSARYGSTERAQRRYFTHSVLGPDEVSESGRSGDWNRTLDYLFASASTDWVSGTTDVLQRSGQVVGLVEATSEAESGDDATEGETEGETEADSETSEALNWTLSADPLRLSDHAPVFGVWEVQP